MIQYDINNVETEFKEEEVCSVCGGPLHDEVFIWDDDSMEYILLGGNGGPKRECRLTEEDYELIEAHEMEHFYSWERIMSKADEEAIQKSWSGYKNGSLNNSMNIRKLILLTQNND